MPRHTREGSVYTIREEIALLEEQMRELFYLPIINDDVVNAYNIKYRRREELLKYLPRNKY